MCYNRCMEFRRECSVCGRDSSRVSFRAGPFYEAKHRGVKPRGRPPVCIPCSRKKSRSRAGESDEPQTTEQMQRQARTYDVPWLEFLEMTTRHGGKCWCCRTRLWKVVDHEHDTKRVRGLLCQDCNLGIGKLGDDLEGVARAVAYLSSTD